MTIETAQRLIPAPLPRIREILLQPRHLPEWNPAFRTLSGPTTAKAGERYSLTVRGGLRGHVEYTEIGDRDVAMAWRVPGFQETGTWRLESRGAATLVTHQFAHEGPLARALSSAFVGVAELRLERLADRAATDDPVVT